jgi:hypothetical protein
VSISCNLGSYSFGSSRNSGNRAKFIFCPCPHCRINLGICPTLSAVTKLLFYHLTIFVVWVTGSSINYKSKTQSSRNFHRVNEGLQMSNAQLFLQRLVFYHFIIKWEILNLYCQRLIIRIFFWQIDLSCTYLLIVYFNLFNNMGKWLPTSFT